MLTSSKCVLVLSDEGLSIYEAASSKTSLMDSIPWETEDFEETVAEIIKHKSKGRPLVMFNDMVEQHYRKERIPKATFLDKANIVKRRLSAAFPSYPMRASLRLKDKNSSVAGEASGDIYLFAAVPLSDNVRKTFEAVRRAHASISGFGLLPVESSSMVQTLGRKLGKGLDRQSVWTVFVGQHQSGGLRQVVTRNGELALTRMTPIIDSDADPDTWSSEVVTEIKGTMSYLTRFGFDASDGLDVIVIASNSTADLVAAKVDFDCNLNVLTSVEAGNLLGLRLGVQKEQRYADPLHVAWLGKKKALALPLKSSLIDDITRPVRIAMVIMLILLAASAELGYRTIKSLDLWEKSAGQLTAAKASLEATRIEHQKELDIKTAAGIDFEKIDKATKVYNAIDSKSMKVLPMLDTIGRALGPDVSLQSLTIKPKKPPQPGDPEYVDPNTIPPVDVPETAATENPDGTVTPVTPTGEQYEIVLRIVFPVGLDPKLGVAQINELYARLETALPHHKVAIIKQVADLSYTGNFVGEASTAPNMATAPTELEAEIIITGTLQ